MSRVQLGSNPETMLASALKSTAEQGGGPEDKGKSITSATAPDTDDDDDWTVIEEEDVSAGKPSDDSAKEHFSSLELEKIVTVIAKGAQVDLVAAANSITVSVLLKEVCQYVRTLSLEGKAA
jgi:hypothetical protein